MKLVRPISVTDAVLTSSNVAENDYAAWSSLTTYASGDHVISTSTHKVYSSAQGSNTNHDPTTDDGTWWTEVSATNRWLMFDAKVGSQTSNADSIAVEFSAPSRVDTVGLLNISGTSAQITVTDATEGVVYDETFSLISTSGIVDWYSYFTEAVERVTDLTVSDLPPYASPTVDVTISESGGTAKCGELVIGLSKDIGTTGLGARVGITDYSTKTQDAFGDFSIVERAFSKTGNFSVLSANTEVDTIARLLSTYRATPILYIGDDAYGSTAIYGYYRDFAIEITYPDYSICTLELEGLT